MRALFFALAGFAALVISTPEAGAFNQWSVDGTSGNCASCHGDFRAGNYSSFKEGTAWETSPGVGTSLHDGHRFTMLSSDCNTCHSTGPRFPVILDSSVGGTGFAPIACMGCHGRNEDAGGDALSGGLGRGLRQHHQDAGVTLCAGCHSDAAGPAGVGENVPPPYYFTPDSFHPLKPVDACDADGSESVFGAVGLDNDGDGLDDAADVADCGPGNTAPVAVDDSFTTDEDVTLVVAAPGVLANDTDADSDPLTAVLDAGPASGGLTLNADGSFTYVPNANFNGSDSFTYFANDGTENSATAATVSITVNPVNDPPVADANGPYSGTVGVAVTFDGSGSMDPDGDALTYSWDFGDGGTGTGVSPSHAYAVAGTFTVTLTVSDGALTDTATSSAAITAPTNIPPTADANGPYTGTVGVAVTFDGSGSSDVDGTIVAYDWDFGDGGTGTGVSPSHTYAAAGTFTVTLTVTDDGSATDTATSTATISATPNTAPVAVDDAYTTDEDVSLVVPAPGVLANDTDADSDPLTAVLDAGPGSGTLVLNADGSFTYTPNPDFNGSDSFTYFANDGTVNSATAATVSITVNPVNDPPTADANGPYTGSVGVAVTFDGSGSMDPDGDALTYDWDFGDGNTGTGVSPSHAYAAAGTYTVTLTVSDGVLSDTATATASITDGVVVDLDIVRFKASEKVKVSPVPPPTGGADGEALYLANCAFCHGDDGSGGSTGENVQRADFKEISEAIAKEDEMMFLSFLTDGEVQAIADFLRGMNDDKKDEDDGDENVVTLLLVVENGGEVDEIRPVMITGMVKDREVYSAMIDVAAQVNTDTTMYFTKVKHQVFAADLDLDTKSHDEDQIRWVVEILDDDPDDDTAVAYTKIKFEDDDD